MLGFKKKPALTVKVKELVRLNFKESRYRSSIGSRYFGDKPKWVREFDKKEKVMRVTNWGTGIG